MNRRDPASRGAFSLLEVMIATAILAGSAMVLLSLIDFGTRLGSRSESRINALVLAQSILDEAIARLASSESQTGYSGEIPGTPSRYFRVAVDVIPAHEASEDWNDPEPPQLAEGPVIPSLNGIRTDMLCVTVELFEGSSVSRASSDPLVKLARWVRVPATRPGVER